MIKEICQILSCKRKFSWSQYACILYFLLVIEHTDNKYNVCACETKIETSANI